jgi:integrase
MRYAMPNPELINGNYYLRLHVPKDLATKAKGTTVAIPVGDAIRYQRVGSVVKVSLQTKVAAEAKQRFTQALAAVEAHWDGLRRGPVKLTHKQCVGLAGELYSDFVRVSDDNPGPPDLWKQIRKWDEEAKTPRLRPIETLMVPNPKPSADWSIEERFGGFADIMLQRHKLQVDAASRWQLVLQIAKALDKATAVILRKAEGDYSESGETKAFPQFVPPSPADSDAAPTSKTELKTGRVSITQLFGLWELDHLAAGKSPRTVKDFRHKAASLIRFLGHEDAEKVSPEDISNWCDNLKLNQGISPRTVSQKYLAVVKLIYAIGVEKRKIKDNPAKDYKVRHSKPKKMRPAGFTDTEALAILRATVADDHIQGRRSEENRRAIRWLPWICAFTGARITEAAQLRTIDLIEEGGILCLRITPEAGSVKTGNYRTVPLHPQLLDMGLPAMIRSLPQGPIFYNLKPFRGVAADPVERAQNAGAKVGEWVRKVVKITDPVLQPNHAWRHRFKTVAREVGMDVEIRDAIQGHEDGKAASDYGEVTIKAMWNALQAFPRYVVDATP